MRARPDRHEIPTHLVHRGRASQERIEGRDVRGGGGCDGKGPPGVDQGPYHRGVSVGGFSDHALQGLDDRGRTDFVVVLTDHVFLRRDVRGREQPEDRRAIVRRFRRQLEIFRGGAAGSTIFAGVLWAARIELQVQVEDSRLAISDAADLLRDRPSDHRRGHVVQFEDAEDLLDALWQDREHHSLLALRHPDLPRGEAFLLQRDPLEIDLGAEPSRQGHLADDARKASASKVLHAVEQPALRRLDARVDQRLLEDRVPELDGPRFPLPHGPICQVDACVRHTMDPVAARLASAQDEDIAHGGGPVAHELRFLREADARDVHDDVAEVSLVEHDAAGDGGNADAVPIIPDPRDDAAEQVLRMPRAFRQAFRRGVEGSEVERVGEGDRLGAHREHVPEDPADPRVRASVRLDRGRMVVALDPQGVRVVVIEFHHAGIAAVNHIGSLHRENEFLQEDLRGLVATVFRPRLAKALQLNVGRLPADPPKIFLDPGHLLDAEGQTELLA